MAKVIIIDPVKLQIIEAQYSGTLEQLYTWIRTDMVEYVSGSGAHLIVDKGGLFKRAPSWYWPQFYHIPIRGVGVLIGMEGDKEVDVPYTPEKIISEIYWELLMTPKERGPNNGLH